MKGTEGLNPCDDDCWTRSIARKTVWSWFVGGIIDLTRILNLTGISGAEFKNST